MNQIRFVAAVAVMLSGAMTGIGGTVVAPNANATVAGNDTSGPLVGSLSGRIQIVINPGQFPAGPILITGFTFRAAPGTGALNLNVSASVYLSTSPNFANSNGHPLMSTTLANNVGKDNTLVVSGNSTITGPGCAAPGPCPFASNIVFTTPFPYNPANGPLLIDIQATSFGGPGPGQMDVIDCPNTSCVINSAAAIPAGAPASSNNGSSIVQVTYSAVPPATSTNLTLDLTQSAQTHTAPYSITFAETGSAGALGNATLYMNSSNPAVDPKTDNFIPPIPLTAALCFDQLDCVNASFSENDINFATEPTFTLSGGAITGGTGTYAGATGSLNLTFNKNAQNANVYTTTGSGNVTVGGTTTALTLTKFQGSGGTCPPCGLNYNNITYTGTASPLGNVTFASTIDVTNTGGPEGKVLFGPISLNATDSFNVFTTNLQNNNVGDVANLVVAGGTGAYAGATGSLSLTIGQNSAGAITYQGTGTLTTGAAGAPLITSVKTAFGAPVIAYNTWLQINGTNLTPANTPAAGVVWSNAPEFAQGKMPTKLGPMSVTINGLPGYIFFYCSAATDTACTAGDQINVLTPLDTSSAQNPVEVVVTNNGVSSAPFLVVNNGYSPTLPLFDAVGHVVARHSVDFSLLGPASLFGGGVATPAKAGETIVLVSYGLGAPSGTAPTEGSATQSGSLPSKPQCWISGVQANVAAALISPGLYQLNVTVPAGTASGDNPITCVYQGYPTFPGTLIAVQ